MNNYDKFISAVSNLKVVEVTFDSNEKGVIKRKCIPFDYGPSRRNMSPNPDRFHFYDLDSPEGEHTLSILPEQLISITILAESFNPATYVTWTPNWFIRRDWGRFS